MGRRTNRTNLAVPAPSTGTGTPQLSRGCSPIGLIRISARFYIAPLRWISSLPVYPAKPQFPAGDPPRGNTVSFPSKNWFFAPVSSCRGSMRSAGDKLDPAFLTLITVNASHNRFRLTPFT